MKRFFEKNLPVLLLIAVLAFIYHRFLNDPFNDRYFDKATWQQFYRSKDMNNPRGQMFDNLKTLLLRKKPTKEEVVTMLGEPDFNSFFKKEDKTYSYNLGAWSGYRMDQDSMEIEFSTAGILTDVYRVQH